MGIPMESVKSYSNNNSEEPRLPNTTGKTRKSKSNLTANQSQKRSGKISSDSIGYYLSSIGRVNLLTAADEILLAKEVQTLKVLLKKVSENSEISETLALKSDFNFKKDKSTKFEEKISEEDIKNGIDPKSFKSDLESSIFSGSEEFSKIDFCYKARNIKNVPNIIKKQPNLRLVQSNQELLSMDTYKIVFSGISTLAFELREAGLYVVGIAKDD